MKTIKYLLTFLIITMSVSCSTSPAHSLKETTYSDNALLGETMRLNYSGLNDVQDSGQDTRMIAYTVSLELSVKNTGTTRELLAEQVKISEGFIIKESENSINARIPVKNLDAFMKAAKTYGQIENETKRGTDITDQYRDNLVRLSSLKNVRDRYMTLLQKANTVPEILSIEKELERINTEIEIMEGRIKYAEQSVAYSNVTVRYKEKAKPGPIGWIFYGLFLGVKWLFVWG